MSSSAPEVMETRVSHPRLFNRLKAFLNRIEALCQRHLFMSFGLIVIGWLLSIGWIAMRFSPTHAIATVSPSLPSLRAFNRLAENVSAMQVQLSQIAKAVQRESAKPSNDGKIESQLGLLTGSISALSNQLDKTLSTSIEAGNTLIQSQLSEVNQSIEAIKSSENPIQYLKPSDLPFDVIAIDSIEGQPVVSANYDYKTVALSVGFSLAGWSLEKADYGRQRAEFINPKHQHVLIQLDRLGG